MKFKLDDRVRIIKEGFMISKELIGKEGIIKVALDKNPNEEHEQYTVLIERDIHNSESYVICWEDEIEKIMMI